MMIGFVGIYIGCTSDQTSLSSTLTPKSQEPTPDLPSLLLGRVTAISSTKEDPGRLILGHENGALSIWPESSRSNVRPQEPTESWIGHEGVVRTLQFDQARGDLMSLGADGSWATWSMDSRLIRRRRAPGVYANRVVSDLRGGWIIAGARGVVARWRDGARVWVSAGEHGRATFDIALLDAQRALSVGSDGWVRCWLIENGRTCGSLPLHKGWLIKLLLAHKSQTSPRLTKQHDIMPSELNVQPQWWLSAGSDGLIKVWSATQINRLLAASLKRAQQTPLQGARTDEPPPAHAQYRAHQKDITRLSYHGSLILSGSEEGSITLLKLSSEGRLSLEWTLPSSPIKPVLSVLIDPRAQRALIGGGSRRGILWSVELDPPTMPGETPKVSVIF